MTAPPPVLTGQDAERLAERLDELADLAATMREPARPSGRGDTDIKEETA